MAGELKKQESFTLADGYMDHKIYSDFIKDKYSDLSVAFIQKNFDMIIKCCRELIDNSFAYHSNIFQFKVAVLDEKKQPIIEDGKPKINVIEMDYPDYFESVIDSYEDAIMKEDSDHLTPDEIQYIASSKDIFIKETRRIRRLIMKDLATANITPIPRVKKIDVIEEQFRGVSG